MEEMAGVYNIDQAVAFYEHSASARGADEADACGHITALPLLNGTCSEDPAVAGYKKSDSVFDTASAHTNESEKTSGKDVAGLDSEVKAVDSEKGTPDGNHEITAGSSNEITGDCHVHTSWNHVDKIGSGCDDCIGSVNDENTDGMCGNDDKDVQCPPQPGIMDLINTLEDIVDKALLG
jgi:hypothetical protein